MTVLEWWYGLETSFVAPADLLNTTFAAHIGGRDVTVHPPSITLGDGVDIGWLGPPRILGRPPLRSQEFWGMVHHGSKEKPVGVVVEQLAFTAEIADDGSEDLQQVAESFVGAMDCWWDNVRAWLELVTGQHLTPVGHLKTQYLGNKTPIWPLGPDGTHGTPFTIGTASFAPFGRYVEAVTVDVLRDCVLLADEAPRLAWTLLRDARSLAEADQRRRAVIDAATAGELAITAMLDHSLTSESSADAARLRQGARMLGQKVDLLGRRGHPLPQSFRDDLVDKRNDAVHEGIQIQAAECDAAIAAAAAVVETAFPLPTPPGSTQPIRRLW